MQTIRIQIRSKIALRLLKDLEMASIIKILDKDKQVPHNKVSSKLRGTLSEERAKELNQEYQKIRDEWNSRGI